MWIRLKSEKELLRESVNRLNYKVQLAEAVNELQNDIFSQGMYNEDTGKIMAWLKEKLNSVCPSPEKLKEFFGGLGKKMDSKIQGCKYDSIKSAWNNLKNLVGAAGDPNEQGGEGEQANGGEEGAEGAQGEVEEPQENPEGEVDNDEEGEVPEEGEEEEEIAAESLFEEGFWDSIKSGWNKLTGKGGEEAAPVKGKGRKSPAKKGTVKKGTAKKGTVKKGTPAKKGAVKKGTAKRGAAKKGTAKKGGKKGAVPPEQKNKIWEFLKNNWGKIAIVLIACLALYFVGGWVAGLFIKSGTAIAASKVINSFKTPAAAPKWDYAKMGAQPGVFGGDEAISDDF